MLFIVIVRNAWNAGTTRPACQEVIMIILYTCDLVHTCMYVNIGSTLCVCVCVLVHDLRCVCVCVM